jgi:hypothetical protein
MTEQKARFSLPLLSLYRLTFEDGNDTLSRNVGDEPRTHAAQLPTRGKTLIVENKDMSVVNLGLWLALSRGLCM